MTLESKNTIKNMGGKICWMQYIMKKFLFVLNVSLSTSNWEIINNFETYLKWQTNFELSVSDKCKHYFMLLIK